MRENSVQVVEVDRKRMRAMEARDYTFLESVLADDLVYIHSSSSIQTKTSLLRNMVYFPKLR